jgi:hypothetical protein
LAHPEARLRHDRRDDQTRTRRDPRQTLENRRVEHSPFAGDEPVLKTLSSHTRPDRTLRPLRPPRRLAPKVGQRPHRTPLPRACDLDFQPSRETLACPRAPCEPSHEGPCAVTVPPCDPSSRPRTSGPTRARTGKPSPPSHRRSQPSATLASPCRSGRSPVDTCERTQTSMCRSRPPRTRLRTSPI